MEGSETHPVSGGRGEDRKKGPEEIVEERMGSAGDPPAPVGDSPSGTAGAPVR